MEFLGEGPCENFQGEEATDSRLAKEKGVSNSTIGWLKLIFGFSWGFQEPGVSWGF